MNCFMQSVPGIKTRSSKWQKRFSNDSTKPNNNSMINNIVDDIFICYSFEPGKTNGSNSEYNCLRFVDHFLFYTRVFHVIIRPTSTQVFFSLFWSFRNGYYFFCLPINKSQFFHCFFLNYFSSNLSYFILLLTD